ncbi:MULTISPECIES: ABC transporter permease [Geobacillus]|jgi:peptide/nickel transport system permease protein|uniref:ABC transporter permease n=1 Tax=Geobacillus thermodenitrificans TaxID=33940 RepID=A0ABY9QJ91_GEOTD|nr:MULTISPECIES: ABC transporter permease [Geobacillus]ARA99841.1 peptide ABC transporter permease [Geobacillus thermodenitrificans]ARP43125.1 Putative peptide transport system permease protein [Geobacillus thermodenitrificans]ATO39128.1 peptide ABC transporter permease [Geobacillus thermodenitrificans]MED3716238.1 ABC transporter permease [Geobacillus thermodenitrificans]MED3907567.1 ABC transporter permease [Geobacillus thermodenitrificans]
MEINTKGVEHIGSELKSEKFKLLFRRFLFNKLAVVGTVIVILLCLFSIVGPFMTKYGPLDIDPMNRLQPPSADHWFGTDNFGRDLFSRVVHGGRVSLVVGFSAALLTAIIGMIIGLYSSYYRILDHVLMRICDGLIAFPDILLAIAITAILGPNPFNVVIAITIVKVPAMARIVRSAALVVKEQTYIEALKAQGASSWRIIWVHMAPNTISPFLVQMTYVFALSIILEAGLSFLGAGVPAPNPSWGNILYDGKAVIFRAWWMTLFPSIFITLAVLGLNLLGDGLRDLLDPHTSKANKKLK